MASVTEVLTVAVTVIVSTGAAGAIILGLSNWLGRVWATRIADRERAQFTRELEAYKADLQELTSRQQDVSTRKRNIYASLATSMRVFLSGSEPSTLDDRRAFLRAYDEACLWASEEVVEALGKFLDANQAIMAASGSEPAHRLPELYKECMIAMRKDSGFPETTFSYRTVYF